MGRARSQLSPQGISGLHHDLGHLDVGRLAGPADAVGQQPAKLIRIEFALTQQPLEGGQNVNEQLGLSFGEHHDPVDFGQRRSPCLSECGGPWLPSR